MAEIGTLQDNSEATASLDTEGLARNTAQYVNLLLRVSAGFQFYRNADFLANLGQKWCSDILIRHIQSMLANSTDDVNEQLYLSLRHDGNDPHSRSRTVRINCTDALIYLLTLGALLTELRSKVDAEFAQINRTKQHYDVLNRILTVKIAAGQTNQSATSQESPQRQARGYAAVQAALAECRREENMALIPIPLLVPYTTSLQGRLVTAYADQLDETLGQLALLQGEIDREYANLLQRLAPEAADQAAIDKMFAAGVPQWEQCAPEVKMAVTLRRALITTDTELRQPYAARHKDLGQRLAEISERYNETVNRCGLYVLSLGELQEKALYLAQ